MAFENGFLLSGDAKEPDNSGKEPYISAKEVSSLLSVLYQMMFEMTFEKCHQEE